MKLAENMAENPRSNSSSNGSDDVQRPRMDRRSTLKVLGGIALGAGFGGALSVKYALEIETRWLAVESLSIPIAALPSALDGLRVVCLSDFHLHPFTQIDLIEDAVQISNKLSPDLVCLLGDYVFEEARSIWELAPVLAELHAPAGIFAILGNHDLWTDAEVVRSGLRSSGIPVLENEHVQLDLGGSTLILAGLEDGWSGDPDLERALSGVNPHHPVVLMMHEPDFADTLCLDSRVSIQLSGHSHGGQVRIPGLGAPFLPRYGEKYDQGLYNVMGKWLYTTRGVGVIGPPARFNCRPEITLITLRTA